MIRTRYLNLTSVSVFMILAAIAINGCKSKDESEPAPQKQPTATAPARTDVPSVSSTSPQEPAPATRDDSRVIVTVNGTEITEARLMERIAPMIAESVGYIRALRKLSIEPNAKVL